MKRIIIVLLVSLFLLSGCVYRVNHEDIAYKTTKVGVGSTSQIDYYIVDKNGREFGVSDFTWNKLTDIPIK